MVASLRRHIWLYVLLICVWVIVLSGILYLVANSVGRGASVDFFAYYLGALRVHQGKPLYSVEVHEAIANSVGIADAPVYAYPPTLAILMQPFLLVPPDVAALVWFCVNVVLLVIGIGLLFRQSNLRDYRVRVALMLLPMLFVPVLRNLYVGQFNITMLVLVLLAYLAFVGKRPYVCGMLLAFITWLKIWPLALIGYFFWKREWKVVLGGVVGLVVVGLFTLVAGGVEPMADFFTQRLPEIIHSPEAGLVHLNCSLPGLFAKMFTISPYFYPLIESPIMAHWGSQIANVLMVVTTVILCSWPVRLKSWDQFNTEFFLVLVAAFLITYYLWEASLTLLLPAYFLIAERIECEDGLAWKWIVSLGASVGLINVHRAIWMSAKVLAHGRAIPWYLLTFPFLGTMLVWLVFAARRVREIRTMKAVGSLAGLREVKVQ